MAGWPFRSAADPNQVLRALRFFISAKSLDEARQILQRQPELLQDEAAALFDRLQTSQESVDDSYEIEQKRLLFYRCREIGIARAFEEKLRAQSLLDQYLVDHWSTVDSLEADLQLAREAEQLYLATGDPSALDRAVEGRSRILRHPAFPELSEPFRLSALNRTGMVLQSRYWAAGQCDDLDRAIELWRQALQVAGPDSSDLPSIYNNLGLGMMELFSRTEQREYLNEATALLEHAVETTASDSSDLAAHKCNLGTALHKRFLITGQAEDIQSAVEFLRNALQLTPADSGNLPIVLNGLAACLIGYFRLTCLPGDIEEAIRIARHSVQVVTTPSPETPNGMAVLGHALRTRFENTGNLADLDEAIDCYRRAGQVMPSGSPKLLSIISDLASALHSRFTSTGQEIDREEAIQLWQQVLQMAPPTSPELPGYLSNFGIGLFERFRREEIISDLDWSIRVLRRAVQASRYDDPELAGRLSNLGTVLRERFDRNGDEEDLVEAIETCKEAVAKTLPESHRRHAHLATLGLTLKLRFQDTADQSHLNEAISILEMALRATPPDSPDLPDWLSNLASILRIRFDRIHNEADKQAAIQAYRQACEIGRLSNPQAVINAARSWGHWAVEREQWEEALQAYGYCLSTGQRLLERQFLREHKERWVRDLRGISSRVSWVLAKLLRTGDAVLTMETGRARLLGEALQQARKDLEQLPEKGHSEVYRRYRALMYRQQQLAQAEADRMKPLLSPEKHLTQAEAARTERQNSLRGDARWHAMDLVSRELQQVVSEIRNILGYTDFLAEPTLSQIQVVGLTTPLAYLMTTPMGGLILLVAHDSLQTIWLDKVTDNMVEEWLTGFNKVPTRDSWLGAYQNWLDERTRQSFQTWTEMIDIVTSQLWTHVMRPLAESLRKLMPPGNSIAPPVTLIPTGLLALLPLHAAWTPDSSTPTGRHYFLDEFTVNYAPSALALNNSRKGAENRMPERLLAIEEPLARGRSRLHSVHAEVAAISELFDKRLLLARRRATREAVLAALPQADVVHFACHGSHDWENALNSGLLMADDEKGNNVALSVLDLLAAERSQIRLVVLSACDTGIVGTKLPDEAIALPIAFLQADCCGVLASLWSVSDLSTAMLMQYFYARWRADNLSPAQALRAAQRWLRDATNEEKAEYFTRYIAEQLGSRAPHSATIEFSSEMVSRSLDARDFASPYFWAAFYLSGV